MKTLLALAILLCSALWSSAATTYYVNAATGNDANDTTQAQNPATPWLTLQHATDTAANGDTVSVEAGTYAEDGGGVHTWYVNHSINWVATGGAVIVRGTDPGTYTSLLRTGSSGSSFTGFTFDAQTTRAYAVNASATLTAMNFTNCVFQDSTTTLFNGGSGTSGFVFVGCTFNTAAGSASQYATKGATLTSCTFLGSYTTDMILTADTGTLTMVSNTVTAAQSQYTLHVTDASTVLLTNNTFTISGNGKALVLISSTASGTLVMSHNTITHSGAPSTDVILSGTFPWTTTFVGNTIDLTSATFNKNVIHMINPSSMTVISNTINVLKSGTFTQSQILATSTGTNATSIIITNNTLSITNADGYCILIGTETTQAGDEKLDGALITGNRCYGASYFNNIPGGGAGGHAITVGHNKNATIACNYCNGFYIGIICKSHGSTYTSGGVFYNLIVNSLYADGILMKGTKNVKIYNNTIYNDPALTATSYGISLDYNDDGGDTSTGCVLTNNVLYTSYNASYATLHLGTNCVAGTAIDNNLYYTGGSTVRFRIGSDVYDNLAAWQALGYDANGKSADPKFISPTSNFGLLFTSPCINAGAAVGITTDYAGNSVPVATLTDIGAYEYQAIVIPIATAGRLIVVP